MATISSRELPRNYWIAGMLGACACLAAAWPRPLEAGVWAALVMAVPLVLWALQSATAWIGWFFFVALLLPPLPIALGNSGPHLALAAAGVGLLCGIFRLEEWQLRLDLPAVAMVIFFLILLLSSALALFYSGLNVGAGSLARVLLFGIPVYIFFYCAYGPAATNLRAAFAQTRRLYWFAVLSALFACIDFYYQFPAPAGYGPQFIWLDSGVYRRAQGFFYEASTLGNMCAFFLVMIAVALVSGAGTRPLSKLALFLGAPVVFAALLLSYSRASLLNLLVALMMLLYLNRARIRVFRLMGVLAICLCSGALAAWQFFPEAASNYWLHLLHSQFFFSQPESVLSGRVATWEKIAAFLVANPWHAIIGIGYKTLPYSDFLGSNTVADNMYLSLLVETGIVGLAAFLLLNFAVLRTAYLVARRPNSESSFFGTWIFCFWTGEMVQMLSGDLFTYWRVLPLYFWVLAVALRRVPQEYA